MKRRDFSLMSYRLAWRRRGQYARQLSSQEPLSLPHSNAALQQESADLIDDAGAAG